MRRWRWWRENNKIVGEEGNQDCEGGGKIYIVEREGIQERGGKIIKLWRRRREIKMKRERGN